MPSPVVRRSTVAALLIVAACASGGTAVRTPAPRILNSDIPQFATPRQAETHTSVRVMVDTDGRADMSTLRITGNGAVSNRQAIVEWLGHSTFEPAQVNGVPVRAEFQVEFMSRREIRRG